MVIQGYLISENTDLLEIESQIQKVQKKILNIRQKEYQHLLGKEIAFCCDCIALNILQRPTQGSIHYSVHYPSATRSNIPAGQGIAAM